MNAVKPNQVKIDATVAALEAAGVKVQLHRKHALIVQRTFLLDLCNRNNVAPVTF